MDFDTWLKSAGHLSFNIEIREKLWKLGIQAFMELTIEDQEILKEQYEKYQQNKFK